MKKKRRKGNSQGQTLRRRPYKVVSLGSDPGLLQWDKNVSKRLERVNELLYREISQLILRELNFYNVLVSITKVETSADLREAKITFSAMPLEKTESALRILEKNIFDLQQLLNKKLKMRPVPKIRFEIDRSAAGAQRIEELLQKINKT